MNRVYVVVDEEGLCKVISAILDQSYGRNRSLIAPLFSFAYNFFYFFFWLSNYECISATHARFVNYSLI